MSKVPSEEALARAKKRRRERDRNMDLVNHSLRNYFKEICLDNSHDALVIAEDDLEFRGYVFYKNAQDVQLCEENGISSQLRDFVYEELERQGRGSKDGIVVSFEFDSDENVQANFEGDYYLRMR